MKISELQADLEMIFQRHGDIEIIFADYDLSHDGCRELFLRVNDVSVEVNSHLTQHNFPGMSVLVLRNQ